MSARKGALQLVECSPDDPEATYVILNPTIAGFDQTIEAVEAVGRKAESYLHFPWRALDDLVGGMPPGDLWYVGGFSGHGKTTFLTSLVLDWVEAGVAVYYMGLESQPKVLRTHFACKRLGYDAGDLLSGAYLAWDNADLVRKQVAAEIHQMGMAGSDWRSRLMISPAKAVDEGRLRGEAMMAADCGVRVLVVDHVDHLEGDGGSLYEASVRANRALLDIAQEYGFLVIAATQFNLAAVRAARALKHVAPKDDYIKMGNHKREIASGVLGLYRPLKLTGVDKKLLAAFNAGHAEQQEVIEPFTMAVSLMKHRLYGAREGKRVYLGVDHGRVVDLPERDIGGVLNGIRTARGI